MESPEWLGLVIVLCLVIFIIYLTWSHKTPTTPPAPTPVKEAMAPQKQEEVEMGCKQAGTRCYQHGECCSGRCRVKLPHEGIPPVGYCEAISTGEEGGNTMVFPTSPYLHNIF